MNLKESYQYQNHLNSLYAQVYSNLSCDAYLTKTSRSHFRSRVAPGVMDETLDETTERPFGNIPVDALIGFACALIDERAKLGKAITEAKYRSTLPSYNDSDIDLDAELSANKMRHNLILRLENMAELKPTVVRKSTAKDYRFNQEGNQTQYVYPVEDKIEIDFSREALCAKLKSLKETADNISMKAEKAMLDEKVDFQPRFNIHTSYQDTLCEFVRYDYYLSPNCE